MASLSGVLWGAERVPVLARRLGATPMLIPLCPASLPNHLKEVTCGRCSDLRRRASRHASMS